MIEQILQEVKSKVKNDPEFRKDYIEKIKVPAYIKNEPLTKKYCQIAEQNIDMILSHCAVIEPSNEELELIVSNIAKNITFQIIQTIINDMENKK